MTILADHLGLSPSFPYALPHPSAWLVLCPVSLAVGVLPFFALDAVVEYLETSRGVRILLCWGQMVLLWPVLVIWGHPEDAIALGFALYGLLAAWKRRWRATGWLFGLAVLFQPLVVLMLPITFALFPSTRQRLYCLVRVVSPSAVLLIIPLVQSWGAVTYALVKQPTFPALNHKTPLLFLAPVIGHVDASTRALFLRQGTVGRFVTVTNPGGAVVVAPGLGRLIAVALAVLVGVWVWRRRSDPAQTLWLSALVLCVWCAFEPVMTPYYPWPALALLLAGGGLAPRWRMAAIAAAGVFASIWAEHYFGPWVWYGPIMLALVIALWCARPGSIRDRSSVSPLAAQPASGRTGPEPGHREEEQLRAQSSS
jgi:hypothetical protein